MDVSPGSMIYVGEGQGQWELWEALPPSVAPYQSYLRLIELEMSHI